MWYSSRANLQSQYSVALYPLLLACWTRSVYLAAWGGGGGGEREREIERDRGRERGGGEEGGKEGERETHREGE